MSAHRLTYDGDSLDEVNLAATHVSIERMSWHEWDIHITGPDGRHMQLFAWDVGIVEDDWRATVERGPDLLQCPVRWDTDQVHEGHRCDREGRHRKHVCECGEARP